MKFKGILHSFWVKHKVTSLQLIFSFLAPDGNFNILTQKYEFSWGDFIAYVGGYLVCNIRVKCCKSIVKFSFTGTVPRYEPPVILRIVIADVYQLRKWNMDCLSEERECWKKLYEKRQRRDQLH